jgi:hypothetical protein
VCATTSLEDPSQIFAQLPRRCLYLLEGGVDALKERVTARVNALE